MLPHRVQEPVSFLPHNRDALSDQQVLYIYLQGVFYIYQALSSTAQKSSHLFLYPIDSRALQHLPQSAIFFLRLLVRHALILCVLELRLFAHLPMQTLNHLPFLSHESLYRYVLCLIQRFYRSLKFHHVFRALSFQEVPF